MYSHIIGQLASGEAVVACSSMQSNQDIPVDPSDKSPSQYHGHHHSNQNSPRYTAYSHASIQYQRTKHRRLQPTH